MNIYTPLLQKEEEDTCIICFHPFKNKRDVVNPCKCFTKYHKKCLKEWIQENNYKLKCEICHDSYSNISLKRTMTANKKNKILSLMVTTIIYTFIYSYTYTKFLNPINERLAYYLFFSIFSFIFFMLYVASYFIITYVLENKCKIFEKSKHVIVFE